MTTSTQGATYRHFRIVEIPTGPGRKTSDYNIVNRSSGECIGLLQWYGPWRQYCLFPLGATVWSSGCLRDVCSFLERLEADRKATK